MKNSQLELPMPAVSGGPAGTVARSLRDLSSAQAAVIGELGSGNVFGEVAERVAANVLQATRVNGVGHDLTMVAQPGWVRSRHPLGIMGRSGHGDALLAPYSEMEPAFPPRMRSQYRAWRDAPVLLGEVKARQLNRRLDRRQLLDLRRGGPTMPFLPFIDFAVVIIFDLDGDIAMARHLTLEQLVDYVASDVGRGGAWNYKASIGLEITTGTDLTASARAALRTPI